MGLFSCFSRAPQARCRQQEAAAASNVLSVIPPAVEGRMKEGALVMQSQGVSNLTTEPAIGEVKSLGALRNGFISEALGEEQADGASQMQLPKATPDSTQVPASAQFRLAAPYASTYVPVTEDMIVMCKPEYLFLGLQVSSRLSGGSYASVFKGSYGSCPAAIKVMVTDVIEARARMREALLPVHLAHPAIVQTFSTRTTIMTEDWLHKVSSAPGGVRLDEVAARARDGQELLASASHKQMDPLSRGASEDGFGPSIASDTSLSLQELFSACQVKPNKFITVIVMHLCTKGTLLHAILSSVFAAHPGGRWTARIGHRALLRTALEMCRGLAYLHSVGVVHGDLKPANVLMDDSNADRRGFTAKLTDFGLCHLLASNTSLHTETWGTVHFMAPEHMHGRVTRAADIYSFGMCLLQMMTGMQPYLNMAVPDIVAGVSCGRLLPPWPATHVLYDLLELGKCCTAFKPHDRPADMEQVEQGLLAIEARLRRDGAAAGAAKTPRASQVKSPGPQAQAPPAPQALQAAAAGVAVAEGALIPCAGSQTQNATGPAAVAAAAPQAHASDYA